MEGIKGRILVVDDEEQAVLALHKFLTIKGYEVYTATNAAKALSKVKEVRPHIVLLDIIMPGMGGIDCLKGIKSIDPTAAVIMTTAVSDEEIAKRSLQLGAFDYIIKPFSLDYLETALMVKLVQMLG